MTIPVRHRSPRPPVPCQPGGAASDAPRLLRRALGRLPVVALLLCCLLLPAAAWAAPDAVELLDSGRADEALRVLAPQANGNNAEAYNYLCRVYYSLGEWDNAVRNCERAVRLEPRNAMYQLWLGRSYGEKAEVSNMVYAFALARKTLAAFVAAHQLEPQNVTIARDLAEYYTEAPKVVGGSLDKARALADEIEAGHPADAAWMRAMVANSAGNTEQAEHEFAEAIRLDHDSATAYLDLAHYLRGRKDWDRFQQTVERAMHSPRIQPADRYNAAEMLLRTDRDLEGAAREMRAYIHSEHTDEGEPLFRAHYLLGEILLKRGDGEQAAAEFRAALALASSYQPAAEALRRLGQPAKAQQNQ
jgi:tetratricopeptide (TPR) repeat protein